MSLSVEYQKAKEQLALLEQNALTCSEEHKKIYKESILAQKREIQSLGIQIEKASAGNAQRTLANAQCADGKNDAKTSWGSKLWNGIKGVGNFFKNMVCDEKGNLSWGKVAVGVGAIIGAAALSVIPGGAVVLTGLAVAGGIPSVIQTGKGFKAAWNAKTDAEMDAACQQIGEGLTGVALSWTGIKAAASASRAVNGGKLLGWGRKPLFGKINFEKSGIKSLEQLKGSKLYAQGNKTSLIRQFRSEKYLKLIKSEHFKSLSKNEQKAILDRFHGYYDNGGKLPAIANKTGNVAKTANTTANSTDDVAQVTGNVKGTPERNAFAREIREARKAYRKKQLKNAEEELEAAKKVAKKEKANPGEIKKLEKEIVDLEADIKKLENDAQIEATLGNYGGVAQKGQILGERQTQLRTLKATLDKKQKLWNARETAQQNVKNARRGFTQYYLGELQDLQTQQVKALANAIKTNASDKQLAALEQSVYTTTAKIRFMQHAHTRQLGGISDMRLLKTLLRGEGVKGYRNRSYSHELATQTPKVAEVAPSIKTPQATQPTEIVMDRTGLGQMVDKVIANRFGLNTLNPLNPLYGTSTWGVDSPHKLAALVGFTGISAATLKDHIPVRIPAEYVDEFKQIIIERSKAAPLSTEDATELARQFLEIKAQQKAEAEAAQQEAQNQTSSVSLKPDEIKFGTVTKRGSYL